MKKQIFYITIALLLLTSCHKTSREYYDNEKTQLLFENRVDWKGSLDGLSIEYDEDGGIRRKIMFKQNKFNGDYIQYYKSGKIEFCLEYANNKLLNIRQYYDENGKALDYGDLKNGSGVLKCYSPEGVLRIVGCYKDGLRNGKWDYYSNAGYSHSETFIEGKKNGIGEIMFTPPF